MEYKYSCSSLYFLMLESGLQEPTRRMANFIIRTPEQGDLAIVYNSEYKFENGAWVFSNFIDVQEM